MADSKQTPKFPASALFERGQQSLAAGDFEMGIQFLQKALEQEPGNLDVVECLGDALMEIGDVEKAKILFKHSIDIDPEESGTKWMYLAQLQEGKEALESFKKGIEILSSSLHNLEQAKVEQKEEQEILLKAQLCSGLCSIAELYMSDLCFEPDAEEQCDEVLQQALVYGPENTEVLQSMASFRISQQRPDDARVLMSQALKAQGIVLNETQDMAKPDTTNDQSMEPDQDDEQVKGTPFEFRVTTARILVELALFKEAIYVLEKLLKEDDEVIEVWALLGQSHIELNDFEAAKECLEQAEVLVKSFLAVDPSEEQFLSQMKRLEQLAKRIPVDIETSTGAMDTD